MKAIRLVVIIAVVAITSYTYVSSSAIGNGINIIKTHNTQLEEIINE